MTLVVWLLAAVQFLVALEGSMLLPLGPILSARMHFPVEHMGYVNGGFMISAAVAGIVGSLALDRFDRRWALSIVLAGLAVSTAIAGFAHHLQTLVACRVLAGLCGGPVVSLGLAVISDVVPVAIRGRAIGMISAGSGIALVLGVPIALQIAEWTGPSGAFFVIGGLGVVLALGAFSLLPAGMARHGAGSSLALMLGDFALMLRRRETQLVMANGALALSSINILAVNLAAYFVHNLGVTPHNLKFIWAIGGASGVVTSQVCGRLNDRIGPVRVFAGISAVAAGLYIAMFVLGGLGLSPLLLMAIFLGCATGRIVMSNTIASLTAPPERRGRFMSLMSATNQAAAAIAVFASSQILVSAPDGRIMGMATLGGYAVATAVLGPIIAAALMRRRHQTAALAASA